MIALKLFRSRAGDKQPPPLPPAACVPSPSVTTDSQNLPNGKSVLIVDDDPVFLQAEAMKLRSAGCRVCTARDGSEAIAVVREQAVDAVLMDVNFPPDVCNGGMGSWDGFQIMQWLRGHPSAQGARFIMVSGAESDTNRQRAKQLGAVAFFQKPLDQDELLAALKAAN
jgi:CheY-like chemotaxis protein